MPPCSLTPSKLSWSDRFISLTVFNGIGVCQSSRTWHDAEINLRPIPTVVSTESYPFWFSDFFCLRWSNGTHMNPEIVAWRAHACDDLFQGLCTSCLCCSCSPLPWWIWCPGTSGTVWKRWSMFAALNTSEYWQTEMDQGWGTPQHTPTIELLSSFYSRCSPWHDAFGSLMYRSPTNPQPTKGARIFCRFPTSHCQSWGCLWGCQDFTTSMPWLDGCWYD